MSVAAVRRAAILAALFSVSASAALAQGKRPEILDRVGLEQRLDQEIPLGLHFRDEAGRDVELRQYFGERPVLLNLVYYECPMLCTLVLNGVVSALRAMSLDVGRDFEVVTLSFDARDTPELAAKKKRTYLDEYRRPGAEAGWHFLTGDDASIAALAESVGFRFAFDDRTQQFAHAAGIMVLTPQGRISRYFYGVEFAPRDLRLALVEASQNRIGSLVDQVLLFCFHYDPLTGRYSSLTMDAVRIGGVVTVLGLGGFIVVMLRREKKGTRPLGLGAGSEAPTRTSATPQSLTSPQPPTPSP